MQVPLRIKKTKHCMFVHTHTGALRVWPAGQGGSAPQGGLAHGGECSSFRTSHESLSSLRLIQGLSGQPAGPVVFLPLPLG